MSPKGCKRIFVTYIILQLCLAEQNIKHKARINYKLKDENISNETSSSSLANCLIYCSMQQYCITVSFKSPTENCLLSAYDTIDDGLQIPGTPSGLLFADGWTTMTKMRYPVFHATGQHGRYSMTFEQAKQQCIDYGTTIASPTEVIQARSMGYQMCACSWMSDDSNGLVVQSYSPWLLVSVKR
ncbi:aggrecan core protein-like [Ruditapes philippinarum]|uniref:aggrecan core protein-like n=1 Tax=Ruditapes philippinarum TaxID=129788 RepID=UPI00295AC9BA|nr:aggrecan core protein-like [Ruditapes philippinarum]